jgi:hypothetical protein
VAKILADDLKAEHVNEKARSDLRALNAIVYDDSN